MASSSSSAPAAGDDKQATFQLAYRSVMEQVYRRWSPEKLSGVDRLLEKYAGKEADLLDQVLRKYIFGVRPATEYGPLLAEPVARFEPSRLVSLPKLLNRYKGKEADLCRILYDQYLPKFRPGEEHAPMSLGYGELSGQPASVPTFRDLVERAYRRWKPEKLCGIDMLMSKFVGREADLLNQVMSKYFFGLPKKPAVGEILAVFAEFVARFAPLLLLDLNQMLRQHRGKEACLYSFLCDKYLLCKDPEARLTASPSSASSQPPQTSAAQEREGQASSMDEVSEADFDQYVAALAKKLSRGQEAIRQHVLNFLTEESKKLRNGAVVKSNFPQFMRTGGAHGTDTERIVIEMAVQRKPSAFGVVYKSRWTSTAAAGGVAAAAGSGTPTTNGNSPAPAAAPDTSNNRPCGSPSSNVLHVEFQEGPLGLAFQGATVSKVVAGEQAANAGVDWGYTLLSLGGQEVPRGKTDEELRDWIVGLVKGSSRPLSACFAREAAAEMALGVEPMLGAGAPVPNGVASASNRQDWQEPRAALSPSSEEDAHDVHRPFVPHSMGEGEQEDDCWDMDWVAKYREIDVQDQAKRPTPPATEIQTDVRNAPPVQHFAMDATFQPPSQTGTPRSAKEERPEEEKQTEVEDPAHREEDHPENSQEAELLRNEAEAAPAECAAEGREGQEFAPIEADGAAAECAARQDATQITEEVSREQVAVTATDHEANYRKVENSMLRQEAEIVPAAKCASEEQESAAQLDREQEFQLAAEEEEEAQAVQHPDNCVGEEQEDALATDRHEETTREHEAEAERKQEEELARKEADRAAEQEEARKREEQEAREREVDAVRRKEEELERKEAERAAEEEEEAKRREEEETRQREAEAERHEEELARKEAERAAEEEARKREEEEAREREAEAERQHEEELARKEAERAAEEELRKREEAEAREREAEAERQREEELARKEAERAAEEEARKREEEEAREREAEAERQHREELARQEAEAVAPKRAAEEEEARKREEEEEEAVREQEAAKARAEQTENMRFADEQRTAGDEDSASQAREDAEIRLSGEADDFLDPSETVDSSTAEFAMDSHEAVPSISTAEPVHDASDEAGPTEQETAQEVREKTLHEACDELLAADDDDDDDLLGPSSPPQVSTTGGGQADSDDDINFL